MSLLPASRALQEFQHNEHGLKRHKVNSQVHLRESGSRVCFEDIIDNRIYQNIKNNVFSDTIFNSHTSHTSGMCIGGNTVVTVSFNNEISCYDLNMKKLRWKLNLFPKVNWDRLKIKIKQNNVICSGDMGTSTGFTKTIRLINIHDGEQVGEIKDFHLNTPMYRLIHNHVFCLRDNGKIGMWDLSGNHVRDIDTGFEDSVISFTGKGTYLVYTIYYFLFCYDIETNTTTQFELFLENDRSVALQEVSPKSLDLENFPMLSERGLVIKRLHFFNDKLVCVFEKNRDQEDGCGDLPDFCIIDLTKKVIAFQCQLKDESEEVQVRCKSFPKKNISSNENWIIFHHLNGTLFAVNPAEGRKVILGKVNVTSLKIHKNFLACVVDSKFIEQGEVRFWDLGRMRKVEQVITVPTLFKVELALGKVIMVMDKLVVRDYL